MLGLRIATSNKLEFLQSSPESLTSLGSTNNKKPASKKTYCCEAQRPYANRSRQGCKNIPILPTGLLLQYQLDLQLSCCELSRLWLLACSAFENSTAYGLCYTVPPKSNRTFSCSTPLVNPSKPALPYNYARLQACEFSKAHIATCAYVTTVAAPDDNLATKISVDMD